MSPYAGVGRASKVAKEEIAGLLVALERFVRWIMRKNGLLGVSGQTIVDAGKDIIGLKSVIEDGDPNRKGAYSCFLF
ncbi:MAG: hypothetical protein CM1200mP39_26450 [Dehalococcoidia bacterium]|nr:MAG: hypothetical protein CM1200mP39_26450 [Dehalococcoidia bacterium]